MIFQTLEGEIDKMGSEMVHILVTWGLVQVEVMGNRMGGGG